MFSISKSIGIDIGKCNLVIRFSEPKTYREFVQSKGRARAKDSFFVILHDEPAKLESSIKIYNRTEEFLIHKFKQSKSKKFKESILPNDYKPPNEEEYVQTKTGSELRMYEAGPFIQRYILKRGCKHYEPNFIFEEITGVGYKCKLNLQGVTPLTDEIEGKVYQTKDDAFNSACLAACKGLYEMQQLDEHFIPVTEEHIVKRCNLINKDYNSEETSELNYIFKHNKQRLMYEKQISSYEYFKKFIQKSPGYDLYEIEFQSGI